MNHKLISRKNGSVYTPEELADYVSTKTLQYSFKDLKIKKNINVIDPACGDGQLLKSISEQLNKQMKLVNLFGIDIDEQALKSCENKFSLLKQKMKLSLIQKNALVPSTNLSLQEGWEEIYQKFNKNKKFDILIANPPWGADISEYRKKLDLNEFKTRMSVDTFQLFLELAPKIVRKGGYFSFIIPDSILNHGKSAIRDILITKTKIKFIGRLGEKIFPGINRACVVLICKNSLPEPEDSIDCFRLKSTDKKKILDGKMSFFDAELMQTHKIRQQRFFENPDKQFDIDLKESETVVLNKLKTTKSLGDVLTSNRGVELGISGKICLCNNCKNWSPLSEKEFIICSKCKTKFLIDDSEKDNIISTKRGINFVPIITGKDMKRYVCNQTKWIKIGKRGINYKTKEIYQSPKILIRKTGVGITACIDYSSSYTTQVVYILKNKHESNPALEFFLALLNSRVYYFYLVKSFGEVEWRSHPYLTQNQIKNMPLPDMDKVENKRIIHKIVIKLRAELKTGKPSNQVDLEIESMIGKMFSLTKSDYKIIFNTINQSEELLPVKDLKNIQLREIIDKIR